MTESAERVRILIEASVPVEAPEEGDDQADTPWSTAASLFEYASGWNSRAEMRLLEPPEPEGEHYFGIVLDPEAESLYCWKHMQWESSQSDRGINRP